LHGTNARRLLAVNAASRPDLAGMTNDDEVTHYLPSPAGVDVATVRRLPQEPGSEAQRVRIAVTAGQAENAAWSVERAGDVTCLAWSDSARFLAWGTESDGAWSVEPRAAGGSAAPAPVPGTRGHRVVDVAFGRGGELLGVLTVRTEDGLGRATVVDLI